MCLLTQSSKDCYNCLNSVNRDLNNNKNYAVDDYDDDHENRERNTHCRVKWLSKK